MITTIKDIKPLEFFIFTTYKTGLWQKLDTENIIGLDTENIIGQYGIHKSKIMNIFKEKIENSHIIKINPNEVVNTTLGEIYEDEQKYKESKYFIFVKQSGDRREADGLWSIVKDISHEQDDLLIQKTHGKNAGIILYANKTEKVLLVKTKKINKDTTKYNAKTMLYSFKDVKINELFEMLEDFQKARRVLKGKQPLKKISKTQAVINEEEFHNTPITINKNEKVIILEAIEPKEKNKNNNEYNQESIQKFSDICKKQQINTHHNKKEPQLPLKSITEEKQPKVPTNNLNDVIEQQLNKIKQDLIERQEIVSFVGTIKINEPKAGETHVIAYNKNGITTSISETYPVIKLYGTELGKSSMHAIASMTSEKYMKEYEKQQNQSKIQKEQKDTVKMSKWQKLKNLLNMIKKY